MALLGLLATGPAAAQDSGTRWSCRLADQQLICTLDRAATRAAPADKAAAGLPPIVRELRATPSAWRGRTVHVPLHGVPFPDSPLQPLAQAVLCGPVADCQARMIGTPAHETLALLDFVDALDPLLHTGE